MTSSCNGWAKLLIRPVIDTESLLIDNRQVYSIRVDTGERAVVRLILDKRWSIQRQNEDVTDLSDLSFIFIDNSIGDNVQKKDTWARITVYRDNANDGQFNENLIEQTIWLCDGKEGRLRIGPFISAFLESGNIYYIMRMMDMEGAFSPLPINTLFVNVNIQTRDIYSLYSFYGAHYFGYQKVLIDDGFTTVPKEVLSLHSAFFHTLFYGEFQEKNQSIIELKGIGKIVMKKLINYCVFGRRYMNPHTMKDLYEFAVIIDRFLCPLNDISIMINIRLNSPFIYSDFKFALLSADICRQIDGGRILKSYIDKFVLPLCVMSLYEEYGSLCSPLAASSLIKKSKELLEIAKSRPKACFVFREGSLVVEFFNDRLPNSVNDMITFLKRGKEGFQVHSLFNHFNNSEALYAQSLKMKIDNTMKTIDIETRVNIRGGTFAVILFNNHRSLVFSRVSSDRTVTKAIGSVIAGSDSMTTFTTLLDIIVMP